MTVIWHDGWGAGNWLLTIAMLLLAITLTIASFVRHLRGNR